MFNYVDDEPLYSLRRSRCRMREQNNGFMCCVLDVDIHQSGWCKAISSILKSGQKCGGNGLLKTVSQIEMDEESGRFHVHGIADLNRLLRSLDKEGRRVRSIIDIRQGLCSENVYGPNIASIRFWTAAPAGMSPFHPRYPYYQYQHRRRSFTEHGPLCGEETAGCCSLM